MPSPVCGYREKEHRMEWQKNEVTSAIQADSAFVRDRAQGSGCAHTRVSINPSTWMVSRQAGGDSLSIAF